jgi:hypothetical protein
MKGVRIFAVLILAAALVAVVGCERKITNEVPHDDSLAASSCFTCHGDDDFRFVAAQQQWAYSTHASGNATHRGTSSSCRPCHTNEGFVQNVSGIEYDGGDLTVIACFTCHQPHTTGGFTPRTVESYELLNGVEYDYGLSNLCVNCHHARRNVDTYVFDGVELSQHFGPHHSPQSDILAGTGGYEYAGYNYTNSAHTSVTSDADGCLACHMSMATGPSVGGHSFNMENDEREIENLSGCNVDACHGLSGELDDLNRTADADFDGDGETEGVMDEVRGLMHELEVLLIDAGLLEYYEEDDAYEPADELVVSDADSAGAVYNFMFAEEEQSHGVHNTDYIVGLLKSSINFMKTGNPNGVAPRRGEIQVIAAH